jgi:hypothetical protein
MMVPFVTAKQLENPILLAGQAHRLIIDRGDACVEITSSLPAWHIPTGTTTNQGFDLDEVNGRSSQPSYPWQSEPISKPAGLHLKEAASAVARSGATSNC